MTTKRYLVTLSCLLRFTWLTLSATYRSAQAVNKPLITKEIACHVHITVVHKNTFLKQNKLHLSKKKETKTKCPIKQLSLIHI